jgi:hypothetical protein
MQFEIQKTKKTIIQYYKISILSKGHTHIKVKASLLEF